MRIPEEYEEAYRKLEEIEEETNDLLKLTLDDVTKEKIKKLKKYIYDILDMIKEFAKNNDLDDTLLFHYGYDLKNIIKHCEKKLSELQKNIIKSGNNIIYLNCTNSEAYIEEPKEIKQYTIDDCVLVRTTHAFPFNHEVDTPAYAHVYDFGWPLYFHYALLEKLQKQYPETWQEEAFKYYTYYENVRETLHFTINGLVQSSMYGDFSSRPFIIIEPLKYHIDSSIKSLRPEDTFFKGNLYLSRESSIIIREDIYEKIKDDIQYKEELKTYNIFVYKGRNEQLAIQKALNILGYDSFLISDHGYTRGLNFDTPAYEMRECIERIAKTNDIKQAKHRYTSAYTEEQEKMQERVKEIDTNHLLFILTKCHIQGKLKEEILEMVPNFYSGEYQKRLISKLIDEIGLTKLAELTAEFNETMIGSVEKEEIKRRKK